MRTLLIQASFGLFVVYCNNIGKVEPSQSVWLVPGTWKED